jgi:hypothetical protein
VTAGLNTSALIEAGIVGRAVHTVLLPEFYDNQEGTLHFRYLLAGGLLRSARDLESHVQQLSASLAARNPDVNQNRAFIEQFVRPRGPSTEATHVFADAVEALAATATVPVRDPLWVPLVRFAMRPIMRRTYGTFAKLTRHRQRRERRRAREEKAVAMQAARDEKKARLVLEREQRRASRMMERKEQEAGAREAKRIARERHREAKLRQKRRNAFKDRIAAYAHRMTRLFPQGR